MDIFYSKIDAKTPPKHWGWYDTNKGKLFWYQSENAWSCNQDRLSEEYPDWYLEEVDPSVLDT